MQIVFMGTPEFAVPALEHLVVNGHKVIAVYTQPDRPAGRGQTVVRSPVKSAAVALGLPVIQPASLKKAEAVAELARLEPEAIVVAAFGQILAPAVIDLPRYGCINVHPSLLPRFRGASPVASAILAGDPFTGVSIMRLDSGVDTGPVFIRAAVAVADSDNTGLLTVKLAEVGARLLQEVLVRLPRGEMAAHPQDQATATYSHPITKEAGEIDWHKPAVEIWRRVRAFNPWPGCYTRWRGKQVKVIEVRPAPDMENPGIGKVAATGDAKTPLAIGTADGVLGISKLQLEGKQAMPAADFLRGQRDFIGAVLPG